MPENTLEEEIQECLNELGTLERSTDDYDVVLDRYERLMKLEFDQNRLYLDQQKIESDERIAEGVRATETESNRLKADQIRQDQKLGAIKFITVVCVTGAVELIGIYAEEFRVINSKISGMTKGLIKLGLNK